MHFMVKHARKPLRPASYDDYRELARARLPRTLFDYLDGGSYDEVTMGQNRTAYRTVHLHQRVLRDVSSVETGTELFGQRWAMPVGLGPIGLAGMFRRRGEVQAARAAARAGVPFALSTVGICSMEEVKKKTRAPFWYQLYMLRDRGFVRELIGRAHAAGCSALVFTVDLAVVGARYRDVRNGLSGRLPLGKRLAAAGDYLMHEAWLWDVAIRGRPLSFGNLAGAVKGARSLSDFQGWVNEQFDPSVTWSDLEWLRQVWQGPLIIKGILDPEDARSAMAAVSPEGIVVSNHGGRQLDGVLPTFQALPAIADTVDGRAKVLLDGGITTGLDVVKALARGADGCLIGRAWAYALASHGQAGVQRVLTSIRAEIKVAMALTGVTRVAGIGPDLLV